MEQEEAFEVDLRLIQDMLGTLSNLEVAGVDQIQGLSTILDAMLSCSRIVLGKVKYIPSQLLEQWLWKTLSENFIKYFAIAESFMEALVQDALGLRDETLSIDQIVNLLLKPFVRPMWYRFFLQHIVSNVPNPTEDLLFALTYARSMTAKALEAKRLTHYDHFDEIIALENMFDASTCQSLDGSKVTPLLSPP
ncbi:hypothetical protein BC829DRAFT_12869 [Chytridium lagenaria]|nr:hypothetical protein BC829DRAFT_12869 [Chytridium lagenaria]